MSDSLERRFDPADRAGLTSAARWARWNPPHLLTQAAVQACETAGVPELHDVCPLGALHVLRSNQ